MLRRKSHSRHHAFTFVELMIGIIVTSIVLCALTVFTFGVSQNWSQSESTQSVFLTGTMAVERLNQIIRAAQMIEPHPIPGSLDNSTSPAACMLWTDKTTSDGKIQYCEMAMLQYDPVSHTVIKYFIPVTANNASTYTATLLTQTSFMHLPNVTATTVANYIGACQFFALNTSSVTQLPSLEVVLNVDSSSPSVPAQLVYNTITLRAPNGTPQ